MEVGAEILKVDEAGRVQMPPGKREAVLTEYDRSGMTGAQFARFVGVRYSTLMYWLQKRRKEAGRGEPSKPIVRPDHPRWLEARVEGEVPKSENLVVEMGGGVRMLVGSRTQAEPGRFLRRRLVRRKYVRRTDPEAPPVIAALPPSLQERCIAAPGLLAQIIVSKFCDHLPLDRQEAIFGSRHRVRLPRQSMARWMGLAADWLRPIYEEIRTGVMAGGYLQIDESPIRYLSPGHGQTKLGYFWTTLSPGGDVVYHWETSRGAGCLKKVIATNFQGHPPMRCLCGLRQLRQKPFASHHSGGMLGA